MTIFSSLLLVWFGMASGQVTISEFVASNDASFADGDGNFPDWIELRNTADGAVDLTGYTLQAGSDRWTFIEGAIGRGGYLVVFASGREEANYRDAAGFFHTNFKLSKSGEDLSLFAPDGSLVQAYTDVPSLNEDQSYGVDAGTGAVGILTAPTPQAQNTGSFAGSVKKPRLSQSRGFFDESFSLVLEAQTPGASLSYTVNGAAPSASVGTVVAAVNGDAARTVLMIDRTTTLRVMSFRDGWEPSKIVTNTYLFPAQVAVQSDSVKDAPGAPLRYPATWYEFTGENSSTVGAPIAADYEMRPDHVDEPEERERMEAALKSLPTLSIVADPEDIFGLNGILLNPFATTPKGADNRRDGRPISPYRLSSNTFERTRACSMEWFQPDGKLEEQVNCGLRLTGGWSRHYSATPKKSMRLLFKSEFGPGKLRLPIFGEDETDTFDRLQLRASFSEAWPDAARPPQFIRDQFMRDTFLEMGGAGARGTFVHLYLNGLYWGVYNPCERPDADYAATQYGGKSEDFNALKHEGLQGPGMVVNNSSEVIDGTATRWQAALAASRKDLRSTANFQALEALVDMDALIDYIIANQWLANTDWPHKNWYAFGREDGADGGFKFSPWDSEYTVNEINSNRINVGGSGHSNTPANFYHRARANQEFRVRFGDRVHRHVFNRGALTKSRLISRYEKLAASVDLAIWAEAARWGDVSNTRKGVTNFRHADWAGNRDFIVNTFFNAREDRALNHYRTASNPFGNGVAPLYPTVDAPAFSQHGGAIPDAVVRIQNAADLAEENLTVYYTTDGTDPRRRGGSQNPTAQVATSSVTTDTVIDFESANWRYLQNTVLDSTSLVVAGMGSYSSSDWKHPDFDDSGWPVGAAPLGYGGFTGITGPYGTELDRQNAAGEDNATYYFRKAFTVNDQSSRPTMEMRLKIDDGVIVYLNGEEIYRNFLPLGEVTGTTRANSNSSEREIYTQDVPLFPGRLRSGSNVLAIELHQGPTSSSARDLALDVQLTTPVISGGIPLTASTVVKARARSQAGVWSALNEATFTVGGELAAAQNLVVSRINYHPAPPIASEAAQGWDAGEFEYLELLNRGTEKVALQGSSVRGAIQHHFSDLEVLELAPGERAVLVENVAAFRSRYGDSARILAQWQRGSLSDTGEDVRGFDRDDQPLWSFRYNDNRQWPDTPDGGGSSLVLMDTIGGDLSNPLVWRAGSQNPGVDDSIDLRSQLAARGVTFADAGKDNNGDGVPDLLAFALSGDVDSVMTDRLPKVAMESHPDDASRMIPTLTVFRQGRAGGIQVRLRSSTGLQNWADLDASMTLIENKDLGGGVMRQKFIPSGRVGFYQMEVTGR